MASYLKEAIAEYTTEENLALYQKVFGAVMGDKINDLVSGHPERLLTFRENTSIGHKVAAFVELARRMMTPIGRISFTSSVDVAHAYMPKFAGKKQEEFVVVLLDARNCLIEDRVITVGSLTASIVHPREVFKAAILAKYERELRGLSRPVGTGRARLTEEQMQQAREFPITQLLDGKKEGDLMLCPAHDDTRDSLHIYKDRVHCYSCGFHANSVGWMMKTRDMTFIEAVRDLIS